MTTHDPPPIPYSTPILSDHAFVTLTRHAVNQGFVRADARTQRGISAYIVATLEHPVQTWTDARPDWMRTLSIARLDPAHDRARSRRYHKPPPTLPMWWDPDAPDSYPRTIRCLRLTPTTVANVRAVATSYGITHPNARTFRSTATALLSSFLEAWGQSHILPVYQPIAPHPLGPRHAPPPVEIAW